MKGGRIFAIRMLSADIKATTQGKEVPLIVSSAGNDSNWGFGDQQAKWASMWNAAALIHDLDNIIVVESIANPLNNGQVCRSSFSNVNGHISAPGSFILSTIIPYTDDNGVFHSDYYQALSGTSMAAPHVTGLISYLISLDPTLTNDEVKELITETSVPVSTGISNGVNPCSNKPRYHRSKQQY